MSANLRTLVVYILLFALITAFLLSYGDSEPEVPQVCLDGSAAMEADDYETAIDFFLTCLEDEDLAERDVPAVYYLLANSYSAIGNHEQAIQDYGVVIELEPNHAWAYNNRCWAYALLRRASRALPDCEEAMRLLPDQPAILDSRALVYWQLGEKDKARADLARAHALDPKVPSADDRLREFEEQF